MLASPFAFQCGKGMGMKYYKLHEGEGCGACFRDTATSVGTGRSSGRFITGDEPSLYKATNYKSAGFYTGSYWATLWLRGDRAGQVLTVGLYNQSAVGNPLIQTLAEHAIPDGGWHSLNFTFNTENDAKGFTKLTLGFQAKLPGQFWAADVQVFNAPGQL